MKDRDEWVKMCSEDLKSHLEGAPPLTPPPPHTHLQLPALFFPTTTIQTGRETVASSCDAPTTRPPQRQLAAGGRSLLGLFAAQRAAAPPPYCFPYRAPYCSLYPSLFPPPAALSASPRADGGRAAQAWSTRSSGPWRSVGSTRNPPPLRCRPPYRSAHGSDILVRLVRGEGRGVSN
jgi:hypothetical protein